MTRVALLALLSHWRRRPLQLATLLAGLASATALWSGVQAINAEARVSYDAAATVLGETQFTQLLPAEGDTIPMARFAELRRAGWMVSPLLDGQWNLGGERYQLIGIDPFTAPQGLGAQDAANEAAPAGTTRFFAPPFQILAHPDDAGDVARFVDADVVATEQIAPGTLVADLSAVQDWLGRPNEISRLILSPTARDGVVPLDELAPDLDIRAPSEGSDVSRLTRSFHLNLTAFGLLSFGVGLFIVHGTIGLSFEQRRGLFRTLRALGVPLKNVLAVFAIELLAVALIAGSIGILLGYAIAALLLPDVAATLRGLYGAEVDGSLSLRPSWWLAGLAISLLGTAVAGGSTFIKVARMPLLSPAMPRAWSRFSEQRLLVLTAAAAALVVVALLALFVGSGLVAGFVFLGSVLLAAALALPLVLYLALRWGGALARRPLTEWFWADTRQQLPGLSLALMALLLALTANIGVGTMVSSFRLTFIGYLDQRLSSELYVTATTQAQAAELQAFLEPRADAVLPIWPIDARVGGLPAQIFGIVDHATYRENWPLLQSVPDMWARVASGDGALINEQLSRREGLAPGDLLDLPGDWSMPILGVYSDYGNSDGQVIVSLATLEARYPDLDRRRFGIRTDDPGALAEALRTEFGLRADQMIDQAAIKEISIQVFERTFTVTAALNVLTLSVAGFAILTSLLTLAALRQPQLAPVWALGLTRRQLAGLELLRAMVLALLTALVALPVGLFLAWALLAVINVEAFGWRLPMFLFPGDWLRLAGAAVLAALLAALWPAWRLSRIPPAQLVKVFADER